MNNNERAILNSLNGIIKEYISYYGNCLFSIERKWGDIIVNFNAEVLNSSLLNKISEITLKHNVRWRIFQKEGKLFITLWK